jgi:plastocyanin
VKFKGTAPEQTKHKMDATPDCAAHGGAVVEKIQVNADGSLPHVFVYAVEGPSVGLGEYAKADVEMDQVGCTYVPHVMGLVAGAKVNFKNGDKLSHNVHVKGKKNPDWNKSQSAGQVDAYTPVKEFGIKVICDVHSWMSSYIHVMDHPFFATSAVGSGAYEIKGLYPGKHKFKAWHENWAKDKQLEFEVEIKDGENPKDLEIEIK